MHTNKFYCKAGANSFWITWRGYMTPCGLLEFPAFDLATYSIAEAWKRLKSEVMKINLCEDCASCEKRDICPVCPASMYAETGQFDGKPNYLCEFTEGIVQIATEQADMIE
jgi:radical SAM protein with 4Fe4S-binding SPASM domain